MELVICREGIQRATTAAVVAVWLGVGESDVAWTTGRGALGSGEGGEWWPLIAAQHRGI